MDFMDKERCEAAKVIKGVTLRKAQTDYHIFPTKYIYFLALKIGILYNKGNFHENLQRIVRICTLRYLHHIPDQGNDFSADSHTKAEVWVIYKKRKKEEK